jgi:RNA polymerase sigma factor (sigma-70 family)
MTAMDLEDQIRTLVEKSATGDAKQCEELYEHLVDKVFPFVQYRTATKEQAIDITQDVLIDFFSTLSTFRYQSRAQLYAFVFLITRRKLAQSYQKQHHIHTHTKTVLDENELPANESPVSKALCEDVQRALEKLPVDTREIVVLHHWSRYTFGEIAELLQMTESAVRVRHHRALSILGDYLQKEL